MMRISLYSLNKNISFTTTIIIFIIILHKAFGTKPAIRPSGPFFICNLYGSKTHLFKTNVTSPTLDFLPLHITPSEWPLSS
jgi:hypothetical protein